MCAVGGVNGRPRGLVAALCMVVAVGAIVQGIAYGQTTDQDDWFLNDVRVPRKLVPRAGQKPVVIAIVDDAYAVRDGTSYGTAIVGAAAVMVK